MLAPCYPTFRAVVCAWVFSTCGFDHACGISYVHPTLQVLIIVEGVYSMEGETCRLKDIVEVR